MIEAVASATPVVASDIAIHREVAAGLVGVSTVTPDDPTEIAHAIAQTLAHPPPADVLAADATAVIGRYDWDLVCDRLLAAVIEVDR